VCVLLHKPGGLDSLEQLWPDFFIHGPFSKVLNVLRAARSFMLVRLTNHTTQFPMLESGI